MNGIMSSIATNNHNIPIQLMQKLTCIQTTDISQWRSEFRSEFNSILDKFQQEPEIVKLASSEIQPLLPVS